MIQQELDKLKEDGNIFKSLIGKDLKYGIGNLHVDDKECEEELLESIFGRMIRHNFFDFEFYYNYCNDDIEYYDVFTKEVIEVLLSDFDVFFREYCILEWPYAHGKVEYVAIDRNKVTPTQYNDSFIINSDKISLSIKRDYIKYRESYAGVVLKLNKK